MSNLPPDPRDKVRALQAGVPKKDLRYPEVVIDLETLGTLPGSAIVQIGAVAFDPNEEEWTKAMGPAFSVWIDPVDAQKAGQAIDANTVMRWMGQDKEARGALFEPSPEHIEALRGLKIRGVSYDKPRTLQSALLLFRQWLVAVATPDCGVWGNGTLFDIAHLETAYTDVLGDLSDKPIPWSYKQPRCMRTLRALRPEIDESVKAYLEVSPLPKHMGVADSLAQAYALHQNCRDLLGPDTPQRQQAPEETERDSTPNIRSADFLIHRDVKTSRASFYSVRTTGELDEESEVHDIERDVFVVEVGDVVVFQGSRMLISKQNDGLIALLPLAHLI